MSEATTAEIITTEIKAIIEHLSSLIISNSGVYREYSDIELANVVWIFTEVFFAKMYDHHKILTHEQREELALEAGISIRQTVQLFTGVDLHVVARNR